MSALTTKKPLLFLPLLLPSIANAGWYLGANAGMARTDVDSGELESRLTKEGLSGNASVDTNERLGWRLSGGYQWGDYIAVEGGYTNLGELEASYTNTSAITPDAMENIHPASGTGYEFALLGRYPFTQQIDGFIRGGVLAWQSEFSLNTGENVDLSGTDPFIGAGGEWHFNKKWSMRLGWDRYTLAKDDTDLFTLGVVYRFDDHRQVASHEKSERNDIAKPDTPIHKEPATVSMAPAETKQDKDPPAITPQTTPAKRVVSAPEKPIVPESLALKPQQWTLFYGFEAIEPFSAEEELSSAVATLKAHPNAVVTITGHADTNGPEEYNVYLSRQRAENLAGKLIARGVSEDRIIIEAKGSSEPLADNQSREGRRKNRRAVILVHELTLSRK